jgi:hypothetical protein
MNPTQLKLIQDIQETSLRSSSTAEENQIRNDESFGNFEANICTVKEIFEEGIQMLQEQMIDEEKLRRPANRVVEVLENGQEIICGEIQESREELNKVQENVLANMELFNKQTIQDIRSTIVESNNTEAFNEFTQRLIMIQDNMKEFSRVEAQHETIFREEEENTGELIMIKEKIME